MTKLSEKRALPPNSTRSVFGPCSVRAGSTPAAVCLPPPALCIDSAAAPAVWTVSVADMQGHYFWKSDTETSSKHPVGLKHSWLMPVLISLLSLLTLRLGALTFRLLVVTCYNTCMIVITRDSANPTGTPRSRHSSLSIRASDLVSHWTLACSRDTMNKHTNWVNYKSLQLSLVQSDIIFNSAVEK